MTTFRLLTEMQLDVDSIQKLAHVCRYRAKCICKYMQSLRGAPDGYVRATPLEVYEVMRRQHGK